MPREDGSLASAEVHRRLREQILAGELAPGDPVPSERALSEDLAVNRHAVREALKRLQQAGLVRISQGGATRVLDWRHTAGLDLLLDLMRQEDVPSPELVRAVLEMRASVGVDVVRRCAERADDEQRAEIAGRASAAAALAPTDEDTREALVDAYIRLWEEIVDGSGNLAYRLALNSLNAALSASPELAAELTPDDPADISGLGDAIATGDVTAAIAAAAELLERDIGSAG
jgi:GntR family transcriptional regulator, transcriptional repressor for pyruvate dehydrogenase complex